MHTEPQPSPTMIATGGIHLFRSHTFSSAALNPTGSTSTPDKRENEP